MNEHAPQTPEHLGAAETETEQRQKTLAIRIDEGLHAQLRFIAQLKDRSITDEIRGAIQDRINAAQTDPQLIARADQVREEIEREAAARSAAIAGFLGRPAVAAAVKPPAPSKQAAGAKSGTSAQRGRGAGSS